MGLLGRRDGKIPHRALLTGGIVFDLILALHYFRYHTEKKSANHPPCAREKYMDNSTHLSMIRPILSLEGLPITEVRAGIWYYG